MKRFFGKIIVLSLLLMASAVVGYGNDTINKIVNISVPMSATEQISIWNSANDSYAKGEYLEAIELYSKLLETGRESTKLYYNLGNAYFKSDSLGRAILNYNRALKLSPSDEDVIYNLEIANARTVNRIDAVPEFFMVTWSRGVVSLLGSDGWALASLILLALSLAGAMLYLLSSSVGGRKGGFTVGVVAFVLFCFALSFSTKVKRQKLHSVDAIVMSSAASVKSSPDNSGKDLFVLNEGVKVVISERLNGWCNISIASGNKGWINQKYIEVID